MSEGARGYTKRTRDMVSYARGKIALEFREEGMGRRRSRREARKWERRAGFRK